MQMLHGNTKVTELRAGKAREMICMMPTKHLRGPVDIIANKEKNRTKREMYTLKTVICCFVVMICRVVG